MASIFDSPSGVDIPDLREYLSYRSQWPSGMRQTKPQDYPGYDRKIPRPPYRKGQDDIYSGVEETFNSMNTKGERVDALQVSPTEFAKELLEYRAINGVTPEKDQDTINAWNRYKKEQYQRRGEGGWAHQDTSLRDSRWYDKKWGDYSGTSKVSDFALESTELVNPRGIMAEARAMEEGGSAEGIPLTEQSVDRRDFYTGADMNWQDPNIHDRYTEQFPQGEDLGWMTEEERNKYLGMSVVKKPKVRGNY